MNRILGLDVLRALAIMLVLWSHSTVFLAPYDLGHWLHYKPFDGVDLFFVLSGFLIGGLLLKLGHAGVDLTWRTWLTFVARRWLRTIPVYWFVLMLLFVLTVVFPHWRAHPIDWCSYIFFYQNLKEPLLHFFWESWSLSVEEWFYLVSPLAVFLIASRISWRRAYIAVAICMIVTALVYRHMRFDPMLDDFWFDVKVRKMVFSRWDGLGCGMLLAAFIRNSWLQKHKVLLFVAATSVILLLSSLEIDNRLYYKQVFHFLIVAMAMAMWFPWMMHLQIKLNGVVWLIRWIAVLSYALYLVNLGVVSSLLAEARIHYSQMPEWCWYVGFWLGSLLLAILLHFCIERPVLRWRDRML